MRPHVASSNTDHCQAPMRCCTSCQRHTWGGSGWRKCSRSCPGFCAAHWVQGSGADQRSRQSCTVCLKTWLGETHKVVVTLILLMKLKSHMKETMWYSLIYSYYILYTVEMSPFCCRTISGTQFLMLSVPQPHSVWL